MKNITELCREITKRESGKKEVNIAQVREILGILSDMLFSVEYGTKVLKILLANGKRRFVKRMKNE